MSGLPGSSRRHDARAALLAAAILGGTACAQILGLEEWRPKSTTTTSGGGASSSTGTATGGSGGTGGSGTTSSATGGQSTGGGGTTGTTSTSTTSTSTTSTSTTSTSTTSTSTSLPPCDCHGANPCFLDASCNGGTCAPQAVPMNTPLDPAEQVEGDCRTAICDGLGGLGWGADDADVPSPAACFSYACAGGWVQATFVATGDPCIGTPGCCDSWHMCVSCASIGCSDGKLDGDETDVDCGGSCARCATGKGCKVDADCTSGKCVLSSTTGVCG